MNNFCLNSVDPEKYYCGYRQLLSIRQEAQWIDFRFGGRNIVPVESGISGAGAPPLRPGQSAAAAYLLYRRPNPYG
ncbi:MAG: hypothetical protein JW913_00585 [Chitinispirillaceae bacterium]|nr:hypothetical protein [Chitinispirillaceae bacterium]